jgi:hypothetical protein
MLTYSYARLTSIVSINIVTLRPIDTRTRWRSHSHFDSLFEFLRALRERGLKGKWPKPQDAATKAGTILMYVCMYSFIQKIILTINQGRRKALVAILGCSAFGMEVYFQVYELAVENYFTMPQSKMATHT